MMKKFDFTECESMVQCMKRYNNYNNDLTDNERAILNWRLYAYLTDCLSDDLWEEYTKALINKR